MCARLLVPDDSLLLLASVAKTAKLLHIGNPAVPKPLWRVLKNKPSGVCTSQEPNSTAAFSLASATILTTTSRSRPRQNTSDARHHPARMILSSEKSGDAWP